MGCEPSNIRNHPREPKRPSFDSPIAPSETHTHTRAGGGRGAARVVRAGAAGGRVRRHHGARPHGPRRPPGAGAASGYPRAGEALRRDWVLVGREGFASWVHPPRVVCRIVRCVCTRRSAGMCKSWWRRATRTRGLSPDSTATPSRLRSRRFSLSLSLSAVYSSSTHRLATAIAHTTPQAGHYLDTIGFSSFAKTAAAGRGINCTFIDANTKVLAGLVGRDADNFHTPLGAELNAFIDKQVGAHPGVNPAVILPPLLARARLTRWDFARPWGATRTRHTANTCP